MRADLQKLIENVPVEEKEAAKKNFDGFLSYYEKFLKNDGTQVEWEKIEKLPNDAVSTLQFCTLIFFNFLNY